MKFFYFLLAIFSVHLQSEKFESSNFVSADWLHENLKDVRVLDTSWYMPGGETNGIKGFNSQRIPTSTFVDLDAISDSTSGFMHQLVGKEQFSEYFSKLGVKHTDHIVLYDQQGIFVAPRVFYMFKTFGHKGKISILDGGLPGWLEREFETETEANEVEIIPESNYHVENDNGFFIGLEEIMNHINQDDSVIIDARWEEHFDGTSGMPGMKVGHIPTAKNVPFMDLTVDMKKIRSKEEMKEVFEDAIGSENLSNEETKYIIYCVSGVVACVVGLGLSEIGVNNFQVYDGSWMEYQSIEDIDIIGVEL